MVETKTPEYWEAIAKQGDIDKKLKKQIQPLFTQYHEIPSESIFEKNSDKFTDTFQKELDTTLIEFFSSYSELSKNEIRKRKKIMIFIGRK